MTGVWADKPYRHKSAAGTVRAGSQVKVDFCDAEYRIIGIEMTMGGRDDGQVRYLTSDVKDAGGITLRQVLTPESITEVVSY